MDNSQISEFGVLGYFRVSPGGLDGSTKVFGTDTVLNIEPGLRHAAVSALLLLQSGMPGLNGNYEL